MHFVVRESVKMSLITFRIITVVCSSPSSSVSVETTALRFLWPWHTSFTSSTRISVFTHARVFSSRFSRRGHSSGHLQFHLSKFCLGRCLQTCSLILAYCFVNFLSFTLSTSPNPNRPYLYHLPLHLLPWRNVIIALLSTKYLLTNL